MSTRRIYFLLPFTNFTRTSNFCSHQALVNNKFQSKDENKIVEHFGGLKRNENFIKPAEKFVENWGVIRWPRHGCGGRSYALIGTLADIERALLDYAFDFVWKQLQLDDNVKNVEIVNVEDILPVSTTRACGVPFQTGQNPMQYRIFNADDIYNSSQKQIELSDDLDFCLSGTAEMGIANQLKNRVFQQDQLPTYFLSESTCFRPEISKGGLECGLYRVHQFKKVEMFVVCTEKQSLDELMRIVNIQKNLFSSLGLHCRLLDMCKDEMGSSASRKFDIEAWMPGRKEYGEVSSASNCTDYQSRRLKISYRSGSSSNNTSLHYCHTCNGTGMASSRTIMALLESCQLSPRHGLQLPKLMQMMLPAERSSVLKCGKAKPIVYFFDNGIC
uniref:serine--tRNA ligase n=1 Tax=Meloidogyne javanica TaxID=6303 RepID=A0A915LGW2_MELJA